LVQVDDEITEKKEFVGYKKVWGEFCHSELQKGKRG
jgi:hypothetical protein